MLMIRVTLQVSGGRHMRVLVTEPGVEIGLEENVARTQVAVADASTDC